MVVGKESLLDTTPISQTAILTASARVVQLPQGMKLAIQDSIGTAFCKEHLSTISWQEFLVTFMGMAFLEPMVEDAHGLMPCHMQENTGLVASFLQPQTTIAV